MFLRSLAAVSVLALTAFGAQAAATCEAKATERKLSGAAKNSFVKKCEKDAAAGLTCDAKATEKKLNGAARTSFVNKCERDAKEAKAAEKPKS